MKTFCVLFDYNMTTRISHRLFPRFCCLGVTLVLFILLVIPLNNSPKWEKRTFFTIRGYTSAHFNESLFRRVPKETQILNRPLKELCQGNFTFLLVIHCRFEAFDKRDEYRQLYGGVIAEKYGYRILFVVGTATNEKDQKMFIEEMARNGDILQSDFPDTYANLAIKHLSWMHFVYSECRTRFILKIDDDCAFDIVKMSELIERANETAITCTVPEHHFPLRNRTDKWYISEEEYDADAFPYFCHAGQGYVASHDVIRKLYDSHSFAQYVWLEDVYITGLVREAAGVGFSSECEIFPNITRRSNIKNTRQLYRDLNENLRA